MAKKTTSAKAKTKTAAASARAKKSVTKPITSVAIQKSNRLNPTIIHKVTIGVSVLLAALAAWLMSAAVFPLTIGYLTKDALLSDTQTVFVPATRIQCEVQLKWVLVALLVFTALYSLLLVTRWRVTYEKALRGRIFFWRWAYFAVSSAVLISIVAVLSGVYDVLVLKLIGGLNVVAFGLAWLSEWQNEKARKHVVSSYGLGLLALLLPWFVIAGYTLATTLYGIVRLPWFVYAAQAAMLVSLLAVFMNLWMSYNKQGAWKNYVNVERNYLLAAVLGQVAVAVILIVGFA